MKCIIVLTKSNSMESRFVLGVRPTHASSNHPEPSQKMLQYDFRANLGPLRLSFRPIGKTCTLIKCPPIDLALNLHVNTMFEHNYFVQHKHPIEIYLIFMYSSLFMWCMRHTQDEYIKQQAIRHDTDTDTDTANRLAIPFTRDRRPSAERPSATSLSPRHFKLTFCASSHCTNVMLYKKKQLEYEQKTVIRRSADHSQMENGERKIVVLVSNQRILAL